MKPVNTKERRYSKMLFAGLYIGSLGLMLCVISAFLEPATVSANATNSTRVVKEKEDIIVLDELLHAQLQQLHIANNRYLIAAKQNPSDENAIGSMNLLKEAEQKLAGTINEVRLKSEDFNTANKAQLSNLIKAFEAALQSEKSVREYANYAAEPGDISLKNSEEVWKANLQQRDDRIRALEVQLNNGNSAANKMAVDFQEKESRIKALEQQLRNKPANNDAGVVAQYKNDLKNRDARIAVLEKQLKGKPQIASAEGLDKLKDDNKYLTLALTSQARQTNSLIEANKNLRIELERLRSQASPQRNNR